MPAGLKEFLQRWIITTVAVLVAEYLVSGIHYDHWRALLIATLVLGILNPILRPLLIFATVAMMGALNFLLGLRMALITLPLQIASFGFFLLAINAVLLLIVGEFVPGFQVKDFWAAFWGGLVIGIVTLLLNSFTRSGDTRVVFNRGPNKPPTDKPGGGNGPVIDI